MSERLRAVPSPSTRYSKSIPPEVNAKTSGTYRIDVEKRLAIARIHQTFEKMPGEKRKEWLIGGVLLMEFGAYRLVPDHIKENDCEARRDMLSFIAAETMQDGGAKTYGELPSIEAISIEIGRVVLDNIPEWNKVGQTTQWIIEPEIIRMINGDHKEFMLLDRMIREHEHGKPTNIENLQADAKKAVWRKIVQRIKEMAEEFGEEAPTAEELAEVALQTSHGVEQIIQSQRGILPPRDTNKVPTIPAAPTAMRKAAEGK